MPEQVDGPTESVGGMGVDAQADPITGESGQSATEQKKEEETQVMEE